jgi:hypothetical protein
MKFVLRRTSHSTYQYGIGSYQKIYNHVLPYTAMYCHVLPCTAKRTYLYVLIRTVGHLSIPVRTGMYQSRYVLQCHAKIYQKYVPVLTTQEYKTVQGGTYRYIPVSIAIHQVYRIPDGRVTSS